MFHSTCWLGKSRYKHTCTLSRSTHVNIVSDEVLSFENCVQLEWFNQKKGQNQRKWEDGSSSTSSSSLKGLNAAGSNLNERGLHLRHTLPLFQERLRERLQRHLQQLE